VRHRGEPAMLKVATHEEERSGGVLMEWWAGDGAARVLARDDDAVLLERAEGTASLAEMARTERDEEACRVLCAVAARLHAPRPKPLPELVPLAHWFRDLEPAAAVHGGILVRCAATARSLLSEPREVGVLHGDLHHGNVLDFGERGWLAIDPKRLVGERGFDFANIFTNPDLDDPTRPVATEPDRFARRLQVVTEAAGLERQRLLRWILAWTGLSAAWFLGDGDSAAIDLRVAQLAAAELDR
jgi:streptomycin 6-kinase